MAAMCCLVINTWAFATVSELKVAVPGFSGTQREAYLNLAHDFEKQNPDVKVSFILVEDTIFKDRLNEWLSEQGQFDLLVWHAGERLKTIARQGYVLPLADVWENGRFNNYFSDAIREVSSFNEVPYGVPISTYQWGFYYNLSLFERLELKEPETWVEFIKLLEALKSQNIIPLTLASGSGWPILGWYEYLNLRINGIASQTRLTDINEPVNQKEVTDVLNTLKDIIEGGYFIEHHRMISWKSSLPAIFRGQVAMGLHGNFIESTLPEHLTNNIGYFPFPTIKTEMPDYEVAPTDILLISQNSTNKALSKAFLNFVAQPDVQTKLNHKLNQISPNMLSTSDEATPLAREGISVLQNSAALSQYFDRDANKGLSDAYIKIWIDFIDNPDVSATIAQMAKVKNELRAQQAE